MTEVLIWDKDRFMLCKRPPDKKRGLLWEFVGGKPEIGESLEEALIRECREELDIDIRVHDIYTDVIHEYPDMTVHLTLFNAEIARGEPQLLEHVDLKWILPSEIPKYDFCPADIDILDMIIRDHRNIK